ncbi:MAG: hypothetical protein IKN17_12425 [Ruminococcus sp.]|nr:hypothetical protein [Ruminococcus sp.]
MTGETYPITADLGTGSFAVARLTASTETFITEKPLLEGGYSRAVQGGRRVLVLEGRYSVTRDGAFFSTLLSTVKGSALTNAVIGGVTYASLYAAKAVLTETDDSGIGRFVITLREL